MAAVNSSWCIDLHTQSFSELKEQLLAQHASSQGSSGSNSTGSGLSNSGTCNSSSSEGAVGTSPEPQSTRRLSLQSHHIS